MAALSPHGAVVLLLSTSAVLLTSIQSFPDNEAILNCPLSTLTNITSLAIVQEFDENITVADYNFSCLAYGDRINSYQFVGIVVQDTDLDYYYIVAQCTVFQSSMIWSVVNASNDTQAPFLGQPRENCHSCAFSDDLEIACLGEPVNNVYCTFPTCFDNNTASADGLLNFII